MSKKHKKTILRLSIGVAFFVATFFIGELNLSFYILLMLNLIPYLIIGGDVLTRAVSNIFRGQIFDENFLMAIATIGAIILGEYTEAVAVMLFYQVGELFQSYAVGKSRNSIAEMMDIRPDYANLKTENGIEKVSPEIVNIGDIIVIKAGERVPLDAVVVGGNSQLDVMALTGESVPTNVSENSEILSGSVNISGVLEARVTKKYTESTVSRILELVENATEKKAKSEQFITRFARYYTPCVVVASALLAVVPPLLFGEEFSVWVSRALIFLVVSCPCALVISIPLSFFGGIGGASRKGVLIKGSNYLEALATTDTVVFDKTGTLTNGFFSVSAVHPEKLSEEKLLEYTAYAENYSNHPLAISIKEKFGKKIDANRIEKTEEIAGKGIEAVIDGQKVCVGNAKLMEYCGAKYHDCHLSGTIIHIAVGGEYEGHIVIS
ncbi:MAG: heavy metal translocating P-type ATPase, partial [Oscillospiraceae bacterium]